jgi:hypothetical protein
MSLSESFNTIEYHKVVSPSLICASISITTTTTRVSVVDRSGPDADRRDRENGRPFARGYLESWILESFE